MIPMASLMLHMLGAFAEFERSLIGQRRKEGLEAARKRGKQIGRRKSLSDEDLSEIAQELLKGDSKSDLAKEYGVSRTTLYAALNKFQEGVMASPQEQGQIYLERFRRMD